MRSHAHYLAKGGDLKSMISELHGKKTGCVKRFRWFHAFIGFKIKCYSGCSNCW